MTDTNNPGREVVKNAVKAVGGGERTVPPKVSQASLAAGQKLAREATEAALKRIQQ